MTYQLPEPAIHAPFYKEYKTVYQGDYFTADQMQQAYAAGRESRYPLPDTLYPGSKDWITGDYAARVEWLHTMYESKKQEIESLLQQIELAYQAGRESMREESDSLARACNLADVDYATFLKIKAYMPVHPAPKPMTDEGILILAAACQVTDPDLGLGMTDYGNSSKELIDFARAIEARCKC